MIARLAAQFASLPRGARLVLLLVTVLLLGFLGLVVFALATVLLARSLLGLGVGTAASAMTSAAAMALVAGLSAYSSLRRVRRRGGRR